MGDRAARSWTCSAVISQSARHEFEAEWAATGCEARLGPFAVYTNAWFDSLIDGVRARTLAEYWRLCTTWAPGFGLGW